MDRNHKVENKSKCIADLEQDEFVAHVLQGMDNLEFKLFFHPILCAQTQDIEIVEALVYWQHPTFGTLHASDFAKKIEMCNLCIPFGVHILRLFSETISFVKKKIGKDLRFSINISARQLISEGYVEYICKTLKMFNNRFEDVYIVVVDHDTTDDLDKLESIAFELDSHEFSFALGKYDTGLTTFECINRLPISMIKIDRDLIPEKQLDDEHNVGSLFESIVGFCQSKNVSTLAHGIEDKKQVKMIRNLGVDFVQGHMFHEPLSVSSLIDIYT